MPLSETSSNEIIKVSEQYYILATSVLGDERSRVLKQGETFAVFDRYGDIQPVGLGEQGLYHEGTRFLSQLELRFDRAKPVLLSSTIKEDNSLLTADLTNPDLQTAQYIIPRGSLHIFRSKFLWQGACYERLRLKNFGLFAFGFTLVLSFKADFADIFEVRGMQRPRRGICHDPEVRKAEHIVRYEGLDSRVRQLHLQWAPAPSAMLPNTARFDYFLQPQEESAVYLSAICETVSEPPAGSRVFLVSAGYEDAFLHSNSALRTASDRYAHVYTSNEQFNDWLNRSVADIRMMVTQTPQGPYPDAGVPWFSTRFGRDGIITAFEMLSIIPELAAGVLRYLSATQARNVNPEQDAEPGKILHETRTGEMAALGEVPFGQYYGSVDATPLFLMLAGEYYRRTGDLELIQQLWGNIEAALSWIDRYGDCDGDGFVEFERQSSTGLVHQGWKDSVDSISHSDGTLAKGPSALCEVQGYVYAARLAVADLAGLLDKKDLKDVQERQAAALRERFDKAFWCEDIGMYALALDGQKKPCQVAASNAGHALWTGIVPEHRARRLAESLLREEMFSGWGIRTLASSARRFNPMSYHNGSIWPHDNALITAGLAHYGFKDKVLQVLTGMFDTTMFIELNRLPELFCGFARRPGEGPTFYPVACAPQSWAAAAPFYMLQAVLGLRIDGAARRVIFRAPAMPEFLKDIRIKNLRVGPCSVDLCLTRHVHDVGIHVERKSGEIEIVMRE